MVMDKKFVTKMIEYMKDNRHLTIAEKCDILRISVPGYYKACKRHGLHGGMRSSSKTGIDMEAAQKIMDYAKKIKMQEFSEQQKLNQEVIDQHDSDTSICTPTQDSLE